MVSSHDKVLLPLFNAFLFLSSLIGLMISANTIIGNDYLTYSMYNISLLTLKDSLNFSLL